jgi:hypothetical protein
MNDGLLPTASGGLKDAGAASGIRSSGRAAAGNAPGRGCEPGAFGGELSQYERRCASRFRRSSLNHLGDFAPSLEAGCYASVPLAFPKRGFYLVRHRQRYSGQAAEMLIVMVRSRERRDRGLLPTKGLPPRYDRHSLEIRRRSVARSTAYHELSYPGPPDFLQPIPLHDTAAVAVVRSQRQVKASLRRNGHVDNDRPRSRAASCTNRSM